MRVGLVGLLLSILTAQVHSQDLIAKLAGPLPQGNFGCAMAPAGDVDGDGRGDLLIGANDGTGSKRGRVYVTTLDGEVLAVHIGDFDGDFFGIAVSSGYDVDQDGVDDWLIGAPQSPSGGPGYARLLSGRSGDTLLDLHGMQPGAQFGRQVLLIDDVDGDRVPDLVIASPLGNRVDVFSGRAGVALFALLGNANEAFGTALAAADFSGDGIVDIAVGAPQAALRRGMVRIFDGRNGNPLHEIPGDVDEAQLGQALAAVPDRDGDGLAELLIGAPGILGPSCFALLTTPEGKVWHRFDGAAGQQTRTGQTVAFVGDFDGDGVGDLLIGSPQEGRARVHSGAGRFALLYTFEVPAIVNPQGYATALAAMGDLDHDGFADCAIGDSIATVSQVPVAGLVLVHSGNRLLLNAQPKTVPQGQPVTLLCRTGVPGRAATLLLTSINGVPVVATLQSGVFSSDGFFDVPAPLLPSPGVTLGYRVLSTDTNGASLSTVEERITGS